MVGLAPGAVRRFFGLIGRVLDRPPSGVLVSVTRVLDQLAPASSNPSASPWPASTSGASAAALSASSRAGSGPGIALSLPACGRAHLQST